MIVSHVPLQSDWMFETPSGVRTFAVPHAIAVNNVDCKYRFTLDGMGIAQFSEYVVADAVRDGRLVRLFPETHRSETLTQYAVYQKERYRMPRVAAMVEFLVETFASRPWRQRQGVERKPALARVK